MCVRLVIRRSLVGSPPVWQHFSMGIDYSLPSADTVILSLLLIQEGQLSVSGKRMCISTGSPLRGLYLWLGKLTALQMILIDCLGRKISTQTKSSDIFDTLS